MKDIKLNLLLLAVLGFTLAIEPIYRDNLFDASLPIIRDL